MGQAIGLWKQSVFLRVFLTWIQYWDKVCGRSVKMMKKESLAPGDFHTLLETCESCSLGGWDNIMVVQATDWRVSMQLGVWSCHWASQDWIIEGCFQFVSSNGQQCPTGFQTGWIFCSWPACRTCSNGSGEKESDSAGMIPYDPL